MQRIKKGLQQKVNLINKIKNNLKIKKYEIKGQRKQKIKVQFPTLSRLQQDSLYETKKQPETKNPQTEYIAWINIKKLGHHFIDEQQQYLTPKLSNRLQSKSIDDKLLISTYTSRFAGKNGLMKLVNFRSLVKDRSNKNLTNEILRKTFLQKTSRTFSPDKTQKGKIKIGSPERDSTFYGKINQTNHISGTRFKTLDPRFGGLTRQQLKDRIKKREILECNSFTLPLTSRLPEPPANLYATNMSLTLNDQRMRHSSFARYDIGSTDEININMSQERRPRRKKQSHTKDRYSPWNQNSEEVVWDQLPRLK